MTVGTFARATIRPLAIILGIGTFLSILGPYNTHSMPWHWRWIYWSGLMAVGSGSGFLAGEVLARVFPHWPRWGQYGGAALTASIPVTGLVAGLNGAFAPGRALWPELPVTFAMVAVISAFAAGVSWISDVRRDARLASGGDGAGAAGSGSPGEALTGKLPPGLRSAAILALQSEDHYLRVHTARGDALILMRLSDAIAACAALDGAQTHRSWWVAREAVESVRRNDGRATLSLAGALQVPVSRTYYPALRDAGWF